MNIIADLHIHGKFSRGCSNNLTIKTLEKFARIKGVDILGTGDFTHPDWTQELKSNLSPDSEESGIYRTKTNFPFLLQTELSLVYTQDGKGRRVHNVVLAPNLETVSQITDALKKRGRVDYDGRPIFKIPCPEFTEMLKEINKDIEIIPAHIWTPWFGLLGSKSGFDSVQDAFLDQTKHIHALETGISSDPAMNRRISSLDKFAMVSFSDLHSYWPWRLGRESTIFKLKNLTYKNIIHAIKNHAEQNSNSQNTILETIEFNPEEGKYHFDGHRKCNLCLTPTQTKKYKGICPKCKKQITVGVLNRIEELTDRSKNYIHKNSPRFKTYIPLSELIAGVHKTNPNTKKVWNIYNQLIKEFKTENNILMSTPKLKLKNFLSKIKERKLSNAIIKNRDQKIKFSPGFDGEYGKAIIN